MIDFPIILNGIYLNSKDIFSLCKDHTARGVQAAIEYIVNETGCGRDEAKDVIEDILHMDTLQKDKTVLEFHGLEPNPPQQPVYIPRCPVCNSPNVKKIGATRRLINLGVIGLASSTARSQMECRDCGYKF